MKRILLFAVCLAAIAVTTFAQDEADYQKWMKTVGSTSGKLTCRISMLRMEKRRRPTPRSYRKSSGSLHDFWQREEC